MKDHLVAIFVCFVHLRFLLKVITGRLGVVMVNVMQMKAREKRNFDSLSTEIGVGTNRYQEI